ncbi:hypothetical protein [Paraliomyxa miuraensis]|uniref:hypothetical protein n=1 Tax=Paraliomyxa miuraensis TaxID=376150 RepID=UPI002256420B|nr:hypothetical protein [Paraliomyxa miuraensis]MCX4247597.1 hypothetical protein [Paraliomyxa miuraensis]
MKLVRWSSLALLGALGGCFEDPTNIDPDTGSSGDAGSETAPTGPGTTTTTTSTATVGDTTVGPTTGSTETGDTTGEPPLVCIDGVLEPPVGSGLVQTPTAPAGDDFEGSCGGAGSNDVAYQWDVPFDGFFVLDTQGSDFDTLLYLRDDCEGSELACNDDAEGSVSSRIVGPFGQDDRLLVVVDGKAGETGTAVLNINPVECPSADLTGQPLPETFSNVAGTNTHGGACGGDGNPERAFRWQAEADGLHAFRVDTGAFQPAVYLEEGPICGGPQLQCNGPAFGRSEVMRVLSAGEYVTIFVDSTSGAGDFDIDIELLAETCPGAALVPPIVGDIDDYGNVMSSSCGPSGYQEGGTFYDYADATFSWTSPGMVGDNSGCDITVTSGFGVALSLQQGSCDGPEVQCEEGVFDAAAGMYSATVSVGHIPPTEFTVVVSPTQEAWMWLGGSGFTIDVNCFAVA